MWEPLQLPVWVGGGDVVVVGKCQFVKMEMFGKNISILTNFSQNTAREAVERQAGEHSAATLLILRAGDPQGCRAGLLGMS